MNIERVKIADLTPYERNTRIHNKKQIEELIRSYNMFGQIRPIVIDENNIIWCGNGFYEALKQAGEAEIDAYRVVGLTEDKKKKLMLADNQTFGLGATNATVMDEIMKELDGFDVPGFDEDVLAQLYGDIEEAAEAMSSYGVIDEETVNKMAKIEEQRGNAQEYHAAPVIENPAHHTADESLPVDIKAAAGMVNVPKDKDTRPFIVCPRCGEKIWL